MTLIISSDVEQFLNADRHGILATNRRSGAAQLTPVWYLYEDGRIYVSAHVTTAKVCNLRRDPAVTLCIDGGRDDARYVAIYGTAILIEPGQPPQESMRRRIIRKYSRDDEEARQYYESVKDNPAALIVVEPAKIISRNFG